jgi:hypothetical protein
MELAERKENEEARRPMRLSIDIFIEWSAMSLQEARMRTGKATINLPQLWARKGYNFAGRHIHPQKNGLLILD